MNDRGRLGHARGRRRFRRRLGEVAVFDIVLYIPLLLVALLFLDSAVSLPTSTVAENVNSSRYAEQGLATTLGATVPSALSLRWHWPSWPWCPAGCWVQSYPQDWSVSDLILYDVMLVSCQVPYPGAPGGVVTQQFLDQPPWIGYYINLTAAEVALGALPPAPHTTYSNYYLEFNGTANPFTANSCPAGVPTPMRAYDGSYPAYPSTTVYTWSTVLQPDRPGEGPVQVQMGFWGP